MLNSCADLHFDLFIHLFSEFIFVTHNNKKTDTEQASQNQEEENNTYDDLLDSYSVILNTTLALLKAEFSTNCRLEFTLCGNL